MQKITPLPTGIEFYRKMIKACYKLFLKKKFLHMVHKQIILYTSKGKNYRNKRRIHKTPRKIPSNIYIIQISQTALHMPNQLHFYQNALKNTTSKK